ncbi:hypothetical protein GGD63_002900 [Bradyrhizobium sp. cir1]|uniref:hypothetical protein n=1 Tax=Bradyrhizobium sp. cir1 TaxID=1445730 RepID=UPI0016057BF1|nr:hypothetical protein [Bradyrhizobium sp. cir1]MBB4370107.1 hypothetical protein [Bradyrhizobium sp. cir1]
MKIAGQKGMINTTKKISALRQILAALEHFEKKDYECAITLAAAGEGQCKEKTTTHLFRLIRAKFSADETNAVINWLKHSSGPDGAEITELEVVTTLIRAIQKFVGTYEEAHQKFKDFSAWCMAKGYTNKHFIEQADPKASKT